MSSRADVGLRPDAGRLARRLARSMVVGWVVGVVALAGLSIGLAHQRGLAELDGRLRAHVTVVYSLAWFEAPGALKTDLLDRERDAGLLDDDIHLAIVADGRVVWGAAVEGALPLAAEALDTDSIIERSVDGRRVVASPMYFEQTVGPAGAGLAWSTDAPVAARTLTFAAIIGVVALGLVGLGLGLGRRLSRRILAALLDNIAAREEVLAGAAHELKTPLATVLAIAETTPPDAAADALDDVVTVTRRAATMVRRLLVWSQLASDTPALEPVRLDLLVEVHLADDERFEGDETVVQADARLLEVAVRNLLENARVHGRGIARVRVVGGRLEVHDHRGEGFDPAMLEPFVKGVRDDRSGEHRGGHGLGLALVARIAAVHGARLEPGPPVSLVFPAR